MLSDEAKQFLLDNIQYNPDKGTLIRKGDGTWPQATKVVRAPGGRGRQIVVDCGEHGVLDAASVCWMLHKGEWPEYGVKIVDVQEGLKRSNLRKVSRSEWVRESRRVVSTDLIGRCVDLLWDVIDEKTKDGIRGGFDVA